MLQNTNARNTNMLYIKIFAEAMEDKNGFINRGYTKAACQ